MIKEAYRELLRDDLDFDAAENLQLKYMHQLAQETQNCEYLIREDCKIVVGVDVHYIRKVQKEWGIACAVFWNIDKKKIMESSFSEMEIKFPYKAGFLGFREIKVMVQAIQKSKFKADLLMCDGHGIIHPRCFGEAVHIGLVLDIPSMGIAKKPYIGFSNWKTLERLKGEKTPIWLKDPKLERLNNRLLGYAICLTDSKKPVFVSSGYKLSIEDAIAIALDTTIQHRQPEPLVLADKNARKFR